LLIRSENKNISIISKENDGDISPCLFLSQPIGYIMDFDSFITIFCLYGILIILAYSKEISA